MREGVDIKGGVMPLEVLTNEKGLVRGLKMCECTMKGMTPEPKPGTEFEIECAIVVSAIGQMGDLEGLGDLDNGKGFIDIQPGYKTRKGDKHFAGGDVVRPHLLTTAIGHGRIAAETIDHFLAGSPLGKRPKVDVHHFNLLEELHQRNLDPPKYDAGQVRGTAQSNWAVHNYEDRGDLTDHPAPGFVQRPLQKRAARQAQRGPHLGRRSAGQFRKSASPI